VQGHGLSRLIGVVLVVLVRVAVDEFVMFGSVRRGQYATTLGHAAIRVCVSGRVVRCGGQHLWG
jgi:hypothetical protein